MVQKFSTRIVIRNDSTVNWSAYADTILLKGEFGVEFLEDGTAKLKIGDGVKTWAELDYFGGTEVFGDEGSIVVVDGIVSLKGFAEAEAGAQPRKNADGTIEWILPDTTTVDGISSAVEGLKQDVQSLQEIVGVGASEDSSPLLSRISSLEEKINGTGEDSVEAKIDNKINEFFSNVSEDGTVNTIKEVIDYVAEHGQEFGEVVKDITSLQELIGTTPVSDQIVNVINGYKEEAEKVFEKVKYELSNKPVGTLVDMRDKEMRIMCAKDTAWSLQNSGAGADANVYYVGFKAYAPDGAVSFKEDLNKTINDETMYYFEENDFAGTDVYGRKYSIVWLPVARFDGTNWNYYGTNSNADKYIGWYYSVEWYNADGIVIDRDTIKINLTNENCHNEIKPFYIEQAVVSSDDMNKVIIHEDKTMEVNSINVDKLVQVDWLIMDGGGAGEAFSA